MIIDWYHVIFQVINFLVLVFLLRKFLYGPIVNAMETREKKIVLREEEAAARAREAEEEARAYRQQLAELQERDEELLEEARSRAEKEGKRLLDGARSEVEETRQRWYREVNREKEAFLQELKGQIGRQACGIARQCLKELADTELEALIWSVFIKKLKGLPEEEAATLREALAGGGPVLLASSFEPGREQLEEAAAALEEVFRQKAELEHRVEEGLICGIELAAGGLRAAWSVEEYLEDVEKEILRHLQRPEKEARTDVQAQ